MFGWLNPPKSFSSLMSTVSTVSTKLAWVFFKDLLAVRCPRNSAIATLRPLNLPMNTSLKPPLPIFSSFTSLSGGISRSSKPRLSRSSSRSSSLSLCADDKGGVRGSSMCTCVRRRTGGVILLPLLLPRRRHGRVVEGGRTVPADEGDDASDWRSRHWRSASASCGLVPSASRSRHSHNRTRSSRRRRMRLFAVAIVRSTGFKIRKVSLKKSATHHHPSPRLQIRHANSHQIRCPRPRCRSPHRRQVLLV